MSAFALSALLSFLALSPWVKSEVIALRPSKSRPTNGILTLEHRGYNQDDVLIASCRRFVLMLRAPG